MLPAKYLNGNTVLAIPAYKSTKPWASDSRELEVLTNKNARQSKQTSSNSDNTDNR